MIGSDPYDVVERAAVVLGGSLARLAPAPPMAPPGSPFPSMDWSATDERSALDGVVRARAS